MKNYLLLLKEELTKKQNVYILKNEEMKDMDKKQYPSSNDDNQKIINLANTLGLEFSIHNLKKLPSHGGWGGANRYSMGENNMIFLFLQRIISIIKNTIIKEASQEKYLNFADILLKIQKRLPNGPMRDHLEAFCILPEI